MSVRTSPTTIDPASSTGTTVVPRGRSRFLLALLAAAVGAVLAAGITWLIVSTVSLDITPAAVGW
jgi:hypothetical protein